MIFGKTLVNKVLCGAKTETRRVVKEGEARCRYKPGCDYAVQRKRGGETLARISILAVDRQRLGDLTYESARREGFKTTDDFRDYWRELYGSYDPDQEVWVIVFALVGDPVRLLARDSSRGYTDKPHLALCEEPESVDEVTLRRLVKEGHERWERHMANERPDDLNVQQARQLANKIASLQREAAKLGVDLAPRIEQLIREWQAEIVEARERVA